MRNMSFKKKILTVVLTTIILIAFVTMINSIVSIKKLSQSNIEHYTKDAYENKEHELKNYVSVAMKTLESYYHRTAKDKIKAEVSSYLKEQTNLLFSIIEKQYDMYKGVKSKAEIKKIVKDIVNQTRYGKSGYFWINNMDAKMIMHPIKPSLDGKDLANFKDKNGKKIFSEFANAVRNSNSSGFVDYVWPKPGFDKPQPKVSFVKLFKPFNWVIGTGAYVDDVSTKMKQEALKTISQMRYGKSGYFWINDTQPKMVMHPIKPSLDGKDLSKLKDPNGLFLFNEMVKVCSKDGEGLVKYSWPKPGIKKPQPKFSYVKEFKPWGWIVGTGAYVDDIEQKVQELQNDANEKIQASIIQTIAIALIISIIMVVLVSIISVKYIVKPIEHFQEGLLNFFAYLNREKNDVALMQVDSKDEIGAMSKVVNQNIQKTKNLIEEDKALIEDVKRVVDGVNAGILKQKVVKSTSNESLEELKTNFNYMLEETTKHVCEDINKIDRVLNNYAKLDFTDRVENDVGKVSKGLNHLADIITDMLTENKSNGLTLEQSSDILLKNVDILNNASNEAAASLEETAAALEEMTSTISSNTENVIKMSSFASQVTESASQGETLASQTTTAMNEIDDEVKAISEAISVIDQIAFQTNILSLNAAVEAATAGEAGKGFAVDAQEVRNLASRSAEAANEIKALVENATNKANGGKKISDEMIKGYETLRENIAQTIELIKDIESASKEQQSGIEQINDAISELDQQTQQNATVAGQTHDIAIQTDQLAKLIVSSADEKEFIGKDTVQSHN